MSCKFQSVGMYRKTEKKYFDFVDQDNPGFAKAGENSMDKKCSKCGGELIEGALLDDFSFHSVIYSPMDELMKIKKVKTGVVCDACTQCGSIENLRVEDPSVLRKGE